MSKPLDLEEFAITLVGVSWKLLDTKEVWQWFGYSRKPTRGSLFTRFVPADNLKRELFLKRELLLLCSERQLRWLHKHVAGPTATAVVARSLELLTEGLSSADRWWKILDFPSRPAARQYFMEGLAVYLSQPDMQALVNALIKRMIPIVDGQRLTLWAVGAAHLATRPISPLFIMPGWLAECFAGARFHGAVRLRDDTFLADAQHLLELLPETEEQICHS